MINLTKLGTTIPCKILCTFIKGTDNIDINIRLALGRTSLWGANDER
jgi:hypothetical protein